MSAFPFLNGLTVVEVAQLGPDAAGGHLADLGADVIKVELPPFGDPLRHAEAAGIGSATGFGLLHLRWNRGKRSICLDLTESEEAAIFRRLVARADVVIEGMRPGTLARYGLGPADLRAEHPRLIYCMISGFGAFGPYHQLGSHAPAYDAYAALDLGMDGRPRDTLHDGSKSASIGVNGAALHVATAILSAVIRQRATGEGCVLDIAAADCAALWLPDTIDRVLNADALVARPGAKSPDGRMLHWPRLDYYRTADGGVLLLQVLEPKFWRRFCEVVGRTDLLEFTGDPETLRVTIAGLLATRPRDDWMTLFQAHGIPAAPANTPAQLVEDPQFDARELTFRATLDGVDLQLTGSPIKLESSRFEPAMAPRLDEHREAILAELDHAI